MGMSEARENSIHWTIEKDCPSKLLIGWSKSNVDLDEDGRELGIFVHKVGFVVSDPDFDIEEINSNGLVTPKFQSQDLTRNYKTGGVLITSKIQIEFHVHAKKGQIGNFSLPICLLYEIENGDGTLRTDVHHLVVKVTNEDVAFLEPPVVFDSSISETTKIEIKTNSEPSPQRQQQISNPEKAQRKIKRLLNKLEPYNIPNEIINDSGDGQIVNSARFETLTLLNYSVKFDILLFYEELQMEFDIRTFDMSDQTFSQFGKLLHYKLKVPGLAEKRPSVMRGDMIGAKSSSATPGSPAAREFEGKVTSVLDTDIIVRFEDERVQKMVLAGEKFDVRFKVNRCPLERMHRALEIIWEDRDCNFWQKILFPTAEDVLKKEPTMSDESLDFFNPLIAANLQQKTAVTNIVKGGVPGVPYLIFGPPGTGKTMTLVESIKQTWKKNSKSRILAAATSNSAADLLVLRLLDDIPKHQILRFYAFSHDPQRVPSDLLTVSNFNKERDLSDEGLSSYRIIVVTFVTAGKISTYKFCAGHFTHVFMDEAGHAVEPEALNTVAGVLGEKKGGQIVIAGDPRQLGPIIRSPMALRHGLQVSLLERLMNLDVYRPDPETGRYNSNVITKLVWNFRSHPSLLKIPSDLFYNSELVPKADSYKANHFLNWNELPTNGFPIIFEGIVGQDQRDSNNPSYYNAEEASVIVQYLEKIMTINQHGIEKVAGKDIAVVSPYRGQIRKIKEMMRKKFSHRGLSWTDVTVGSTEELQGQERKVILISTVRSQIELLDNDFKYNLGFLRNPKRFNVSLTRAQGLLVVVGNPSLLSVDSNWKIFVDYVIKNGGYRGVKMREFADGGVSTLRSEIADLGKLFKNLGVHNNQLLSMASVADKVSQKELVEEPEWNYEH